MLNSKDPLWMPVGSVRAIVTFILVIAAVAASFVGIDIADKFLWPAALTAVGFYYGSRTAE